MLNSFAFFTVKRFFGLRLAIPAACILILARFQPRRGCWPLKTDFFAPTSTLLAASSSPDLLQATSYLEADAIEI